MNYKALIRLIRPKHYLKNVLVFLPLVFSGQLFEAKYFSKAVLAFIAFSLIASAVYVLNDIKDKDLDALHPKKKFRPIAAGKVGIPTAIALILVLIGIASGVFYAASLPLQAMGLAALYATINIMYSFGLKNLPIIDVAILSLGFVLRVFFGGAALNIEVSKWLYLAILAFSFYLSLGKRRNEIRVNGTTTRKVNRFYSQEFLDKNMYVCLGLTVTYYSLWAIDPVQQHKNMFWTIPAVLLVVMAYSLAIEDESSDGDPVSVLFSHKPLLFLAVVCATLMTILVYL